MQTTAYKGIVMKVTSHFVVILQNDGTFKNIPLNKVDNIPLIGDSFTHIEKKSSSNWLKYSAIAAILFISIISYHVFSSSNDPSYLVVMDVNPSIELMLDEDLQLVGIKGLNEEGIKIAESVISETSKTDLYELVRIIIQRIEEQGYFTENKVISTSIIPLTEDGEHQHSVVENVKESIKQSLKDERVELDVSEESLEAYEKAKGLGLSINYYRYYKLLLENNVISDITDINGKTISELSELRRQAIMKKEESLESNQSEKGIENVTKDKIVEQKPDKQDQEIENKMTKPGEGMPAKQENKVPKNIPNEGQNSEGTPVQEEQTQNRDNNQQETVENPSIIPENKDGNQDVQENEEVENSDQEDRGKDSVEVDQNQE